jgi:hypothetical protein
MKEYLPELIIRLIIELFKWLLDVWKKWRGGSYDYKGNPKAEWQSSGA